MSTITICDACGDKIDDPLEVPKLMLPPSWWTALDEEPQEMVDICSPACLVRLADAVEGSPAQEQTDEDEDREEEEVVVAPRRKQAQLRIPTEEELNEALGVTQRG